jgi:hypothetical protein
MAAYLRVHGGGWMKLLESSHSSARDCRATEVRITGERQTPLMARTRVGRMKRTSPAARGQHTPEPALLRIKLVVKLAKGSTYARNMA